MTTETRTVVGETATSVGDGYAGFRSGVDLAGITAPDWHSDGYAGFRSGRMYKLQVEHRGDTVVILLDHHEHVSPGNGPLVVTSEQFEKWFRK